MPPACVATQETTAAQTNAVVLRLADLKSRVVVSRDERGIAYIEAASDRLFQMELFRRTARGELSEIFSFVINLHPLNRQKCGMMNDE